MIFQTHYIIGRQSVTNWIATWRIYPRTLKGYQQYTYTTSHTQKNDYVCVMD